MKDNLLSKYYEHFKSYEKGYISEDELYLAIYLGEGLMSLDEYNDWIKLIDREEKINGKKPKEILAHPKFYEFNVRYKVLLDHWRDGNCTMNDVLDVIEVLDKYNI